MNKLSDFKKILLMLLVIWCKLLQCHQRKWRGDTSRQRGRGAQPAVPRTRVNAGTGAAQVEAVPSSSALP